MALSNKSDNALVLAEISNKQQQKFFLNELKKNVDDNNLTRQFFTLGLLEYMCNVLNPKEPVIAQHKFKG